MCYRIDTPTLSQVGYKMHLPAILVLFSLFGVNSQNTQGCKSEEGEPGLGLQVVDSPSGPLTLRCWYTGPKYFFCNGTCDSGTYLPHPHRLDSNQRSCVCCEAETVIEWDPAYYCEITNNNGINHWQQEDIIGPYYEYRGCHCETQDQSRRTKREVEPDLHFLPALPGQGQGQGQVEEKVENVSECREETDTIFTSPCNPKGIVNICRSNQRLELKPAVEQTILKDLSSAVASGSVTDFFRVKTTDVEYKPHTPREPWVLSGKIYQESPEECKEIPRSSVILFSSSGGIIIILILILIICVLCQRKERRNND